MDVDEVKERIGAEVDRRAGELVEASHSIHANPELAYEEHAAHDLLTSLLEAGGLEVERGAYGLDTAFVARAGTSGPTIAVLCEYDALPEIGHACGHNVIAAAGLGAGLAAAAFAQELGGRLVVLGTPAEEGGGGKIAMAEQGAFEGIDAAMMVHPAGADHHGIDAIAVHQLLVDYHGEAAHAAAAPQKGRNALDAAVLGYMNVAALRQHIRDDERIHGIITHGGDKPNIVPQFASAHWYVRSPTLARLADLEPRVLACLEAGALAAGCTMDARWQDRPYADMVDSSALLGAYVANAARVGRTSVQPTAETVVRGSTDMGNVSHLVPSIHPMIKVSPPHISIHTTAFERFAGGAEGDLAVVDGAKALAMTVADLWSDPSLLAAAAAEHRAREGVRDGVPGATQHDR